MRTLKQFRLILSALFLALMVGMSGVGAQTISNTATVEWSTGASELFKKVSNTVTHTILPASKRLTVLREVRESNERLTFTKTQCAGNAIVIPDGSGQWLTSPGVSESNRFRKGETIYIRVAEPSLNRDANALENVTIVITTSSGDRETIKIFETSADSGIFAGAIPTVLIPPAPEQGDCRISARPGDKITISAIGQSDNANPLDSAVIEILPEPTGVVFDSEDGKPIDGVRLTLVDAVSGAPASVLSDDGRTPWPATVVSGQAIIDGSGQAHPMPTGAYRFPLVQTGSYRLVIEPPAPIVAPSKVSEATLAALRNPDGVSFTIRAASFGKSFTVETPEALHVDIPVDYPPTAVTVTKSTSRQSALPGDIVLFTVTVRNPDRIASARAVRLIDTPGPALRFRPDTVRINGQMPANGRIVFSSDGAMMTAALGDIPANGSLTVTYAMSVRTDAKPGEVENRVLAASRDGEPAESGVYVRIEREDITSRTTLIGRIISGGCSVAGKAPGIPAVRVVMEDGSFAITDMEGRYHFQGVIPGNHVVQVVPSTLPAGGRFVDCAKSTRSAGSAISRFVSGQGGSLMVADFHAVVPEGALKLPQASQNAPTSPDAAPNTISPTAPPAVKSETAEPAQPVGLQDRSLLTDEERRKLDDADSRRAAGADTDWMAMGAGPTDFLFPSVDHNPRAPAVRVVIRHRPDEKIELQAEGKPVDKVSLDTVTKSADGTYMISIWRGIPIVGDTTRLTAIVRGPNDQVIKTLTRDVHFSNVPARVEFLADKSRLIADGSSRPIIALRILDRTGRPVHSGLTGDFQLSAPYESAEALLNRQSVSITGSGQLAPRWFVKSDDGIAYVELAPTMVSGKLRMDFEFTDGQQRRRQDIETWIAPGKQEWTVVGLAEAGVGSRDIADTMQRTRPFDSDLGDNARIALYLKGQIADALLVTGAYDSAKQRDEQRTLGGVDAHAYYTVFADSSDRRDDAASRDKMYLRLEGKGFSGFYGDFSAGFDQTQLARYHRAATGVRTEGKVGAIEATAFAARISSTHRRDEIQGAGITGPYRLSSPAIIAGSERVQIEVRDRLRSELIVKSRTLTRYVDYEIDIMAGTISLREPLLSRDADLNPQFVIIDYELNEGAGGGEINAGLRAAYATRDGKLRIGATGITDTNANNNTRSHVAAVDVRARLGTTTEIRAEAARSFNEQYNANAWLVEAEHHDGKLDVLAYARSTDLRFGVGQNGGAERGRRKLGVDARYKVNEELAVTAAAWNDTSLNNAGHRNALQVGANYRSQQTDARIALSTLQDSSPTQDKNGTTTLDVGASRRFFSNRLEVGATNSFALTKAKAADLPNRHRLHLRYAVTRNIRLTGSYEIAKSEKTNTRTATGGVEVTPWNGGRVTTSVGQESLGADGNRSFAAVGVSQSLQVTPRLTVDASVESVRTIGGLYARRNNPNQPNSSGDSLGDGGSLSGDFTAVSLGASWRGGRWVLNGRGEWRNGKLEDRRGLQLSAIRQMGEGSMLGGTFSWGHARTERGATSRSINATLALAHRPANSPFGLLGKLEVRSDRIGNVAQGEQIAGTALTVQGDAMATRIIGSLTGDWSPYSEEDGNFFQRSGVSLFGAIRYNFDNVGDLTLVGTTLLSGIDARVGLGQHFEVGGRATVRANLAEGTTHYSTGPEIGVSPTRDVLLTFGYNVTGYYDRDFTGSQYTNEGPFAGIRLKFDANSFPMFGGF